MWQNLKKATPQVDWQRIENSAGEGVPDLSGCIPGSREGKIIPTTPASTNQDLNNVSVNIHESHGLEFWLELKVDDRRVFSGANLWRPAQVAWQTRRARAGGRVYNLVHRPSSSVPYLIFHGRTLLTLLENGPSSVVLHPMTSLADLPALIRKLESAPIEED